MATSNYLTFKFCIIHFSEIWLCTCACAHIHMNLVQENTFGWLLLQWLKFYVAQRGPQDLILQLNSTLLDPLHSDLSIHRPPVRNTPACGCHGQEPCSCPSFLHTFVAQLLRFWPSTDALSPQVTAIADWWEMGAECLGGAILGFYPGIDMCLFPTSDKPLCWNLSFSQHRGFCCPLVFMISISFTSVSCIP